MLNVFLSILNYKSSLAFGLYVFYYVCVCYTSNIIFFAFSYRYIIPNSFVRFISRQQIARKLVYA